MPSMAETVPTRRIADRSQLSRAEDALILKLSADGKTQTEIAQLVGCNQSSVSRVLSRFLDTREVAKRILHNGAQALAERIVKDADVDQSLEVLDRLEVAPKREQGGNRMGLQINIGMPGLAAGADPLITSTFASELSTVSTDTHRLTADTGSDK